MSDRAKGLKGIKPSLVLSFVLGILATYAASGFANAVLKGEIWVSIENPRNEEVRIVIGDQVFAEEGFPAGYLWSGTYRVITVIGQRVSHGELKLRGESYLRLNAVTGNMSGEGYTALGESKERP